MNPFPRNESYLSRMRTPWVRGLIFTFVVPGMIGVLVPALMGARSPRPGGLWNVGWLLIVSGAAIYGLCLTRFLIAGGTPAIFFTRSLRFVIGEEPPRLVSEGLYRFSRNPMYVGVLMIIFGQAIVRASMVVAVYGFVVLVCFHIVVVFFEEPHLRRTRGAAYVQYCNRAPRWLWKF